MYKRQTLRQHQIRLQNKIQHLLIKNLQHQHLQKHQHLHSHHQVNHLKHKVLLILRQHLQQAHLHHQTTLHQTLKQHHQMIHHQNLKRHHQMIHQIQIHQQERQVHHQQLTVILQIVQLMILLRQIQRMTQQFHLLNHQHRHCLKIYHKHWIAVQIRKVL